MQYDYAQIEKEGIIGPTSRMPQTIAGLYYLISRESAYIERSAHSEQFLRVDEKYLRSLLNFSQELKGSKNGETCLSDRLYEPVGLIH